MNENTANRSTNDVASLLWPTDIWAAEAAAAVKKLTPTQLSTLATIASGSLPRGRSRTITVLWDAGLIEGGIGHEGWTITGAGRAVLALA